MVEPKLSNGIIIAISLLALVITASISALLFAIVYTLSSTFGEWKKSRRLYTYWILNSSASLTILMCNLPWMWPKYLITPVYISGIIVSCADIYVGMVSYSLFFVAAIFVVLGIVEEYKVIRASSLTLQETHPAISTRTKRKLKVFKTIAIASSITSVLLFYGTSIVLIVRADSSWSFFRGYYDRIANGVATVAVICVVFIPIGIRIKIYRDVKRTSLDNDTEPVSPDFSMNSEHGAFLREEGEEDSKITAAPVSPYFETAHQREY
jgi:hypothetical protein